ncbi:MAG: hypothetical protein OSB45_00585 [Pseudomonadales bacterium]|nr:hypothetical protein [Pseudomonadales bacterium]
MYSIRIRTNQRTDVLRQGDKANVGALMRDGSIRYFYWGGFSLDMQRKVKLRVEAYTSERNWDPRNPNSQLPHWVELNEDEYLLGSYDGTLIYKLLPFTILKGLKLQS